MAEKIFFIRKNSNFRHIFENSRKLMKYTCFRNFRKIAILRGSKLSRYSIFFRSDFTVEKISTYIFICQNFIPIRSIVFELWASQNRHFSTFSKTRVFYQLLRIFKNMAEMAIFPYKNPKREEKSRFPPYFGPKSNFLGQHTPKVRKNRVFKNGIRLSNRAF